jgi:hypothetical protein
MESLHTAPSFFSFFSPENCNIRCSLKQTIKEPVRRGIIFSRFYPIEYSLRSALQGVRNVFGFAL